MRKLLSANFLRLWKSAAFRTSLGVCALLGALAAMGQFKASLGVEEASAALSRMYLLEGQFFQYAVFIGILAGELVPLFIGTEYSDGTLRNKVSVGHSRVSIYFANLIAGFAGSLVCMAGYMLACLAFGGPLLGWFTKPAGLIVTAVAGSVLTLAAFCALFTLVTMNCSKKSSAVVFCLVGAMALLVAAVYLNARLDAPEYLDYYSLSVNGEVIPNTELNPDYLTGMEREVYRFIFDLLPTGQSIQYSMLSFTSFVRLAAMALATAAAASAGGAALFRRKDLK